MADELSNEYPFFGWQLRLESFLRFGRHPDGIFSTEQNEFGYGERLRLPSLGD